MKAIYIHIPFCLKKCNYCAFNSYPKGQYDTDRFVQNLIREIDLWSETHDTKDISIQTLFFGGGTPSCLTAKQIDRIITACQNNFVISPQAEISLEANPGTVDKDKLVSMKKSGINRLSFGVQSLEEKYLKFLGRIHSKEEFLQNYELARKCGFDNINLDFMFALPGQSIEEWQRTLKEAIALEPEHISTYNLVLEEGTPLREAYERGDWEAASEETDLAMYETSMDMLTVNGYQHYEISNFTRAGKECRHNLVYWHNEEYIAFGAGAHGYYEGERWNNLTLVHEYNEALEKGLRPLEEREKIDTRTSMSETMMQSLRLAEGVDKERFFQRYGQRLEDVYSVQIKELTAKDLLKDSPSNISLTKKGLILANSVFLEFF